MSAKPAPHAVRSGATRKAASKPPAGRPPKPFTPRALHRSPGVPFTYLTLHRQTQARLGTARKGPAYLKPEVAAPTAVGTTGSISGVVRDAGSQTPLPGVCAYAVGDTSSDVYQSCTDAQGSYSLTALPADTYALWFEDHVTSHLLYRLANGVVVAEGQDVPDVNADLTQGGSIAGTISDPAGNPLAGACVSVKAAGGDWTDAGGCTDASGRFQTTGVTPGDYVVRFDAGNPYLPQWSGGAFTEQDATPVTVALGAVSDHVDATMRAGATISGVVTDAGTHQPVPACVEVWQASAMVTSTCAGGDGTYRTDGLPPGDYAVHFTDASGGHVDSWWDGKADQASSDPVTISGSTNRTGIDAALVAGGWITGHVVDADTNNPVTGVCVSAQSLGGSDTSWHTGCTDSTGQYTVTGLATGTYHLFFDGLDAGFGSRWYHDADTVDTAQPVSVTTGQATDGIDQSLVAGGFIAGTVTAVDGAVQAGDVCVSAWTPGADQPTLTSCVDSDGTYRLGGLPAGSYKVQFSDGGGGGYLEQWWNGKATMADATSVDVQQRQTTTGIDATMQHSGSLQGTVTDGATHTGVDGVCVNVMSQAAAGVVVAGVCTGPDGGYSVDGLQPGSYLIELESQDGAFVTEWWQDASSAQDATPVTIAAGQTLRLDAAVQRTGSVSGLVTDATSGAPLSDVCVNAFAAADLNTAVSSACTGADGRYTVVGLQTGQYALQFSDGGGDHMTRWYRNAATGPQADLVSVTLGQDTPGTDMALVTGGNISGTVTSDGKPVAGVCVSLYDAGTGALSADGGCTDASGQYASAAVVPGSYKVGFADGTGEHLPQFFPDKSTLADAAVVVVSAGQTTTGVDAHLAPSQGTIAGVVTDALTNQPLPGACVYLYTEGGGYAGLGGCAGNDGHYTVSQVPAGSFQVAFFDPSGTHETQWFDGAKSQAASTAVSMPATLDTVNAAMTPITTVSGTVTDASTHKPLAGVCAYLYPLGTTSSVAASCTGDDGHIVMQGMAPGDYQLAFADTAGTHTTQWYSGASSQETSQTLHVTAGSIKSDANAAMAAINTVMGTVTDAASHQPLEGVCAYLYPQGSEQSAAASCSLADGRIVMQGMPAGTYELAFSDTHGVHQTQWFGGGGSRAGSSPVVIGDGTVVSDADAAMTPITSVIGKVTDSVTGQPVAGVCAYLYAAGAQGATAASCTEADGRVVMQAVPAGDYQLAFADTSGQRVTEWYGGSYDRSGATTITLADGTLKLDADVVMDPLGSISGTITTANGPVSGACVYADDLQGHYAGVGGCTDAAGHYSLTGMAPGGYKLAIYPPGGAGGPYWFHGAGDEASATPVTVHAGADTGGIDEQLP